MRVEAVWLPPEERTKDEIGNRSWGSVDGRDPGLARPPVSPTSPPRRSLDKVY